MGAALIAGHLTDQQKNRFLDQTCITTMTIRPIVAEGDNVPFWVWFKSRGPYGTSPAIFWAERRDRERRIDGKTVRMDSGGGSGQLSGGGSGSGSSEPSGSIGKHTLQTTAEWTIWVGQSCDTLHSRKLGSRTVTAQASYEVVPRDKAPKIALLDSPDLRKQVLAAVKLESLRQQENGYLNAQIVFTSVPCDLAFEVFAKTPKGETKLSWVNCAKGKGTSYGSGSPDIKDPLPPKLDIILRPSIDVAKQTVDLTAIYSGEITFPDIPVEQESR
jgi:hypothetical protein